MLALTDAAFGYVVLAANRLPTPAARAELLQQFAAMADPGPTRRLVSQRARTLRKRARRRAGIRVYPLPLTDRAVSGLVTQLVASGRLTEATAADHACFLAALACLLEAQGTEWAP
jgi:hypothetical protein